MNSHIVTALSPSRSFCTNPSPHAHASSGWGEAPLVQRILRAQGGWAPDETTIQRMFRRTGLTALTPAADAPAFGRWEASRPNEIWTGDAMHAIRLGGRKTYLFAFIDDHSRAVMAARFGFAEDTIRLAAALRPALASRGIPAHAYVDYADPPVMPIEAQRPW